MSVHRQEIDEIVVVTIVSGEPWRQNCYLVLDQLSSEAMLIDPGDNASAILATIDEYQPSSVEILLTHGHHDHVGAAADVAEKLGTPCLIHEADARLARQAPLWAFRFSGKRIRAPEPLEPFITWKRPFGQGFAASIHTPGHTPGGVCYIFPGFAVTGDTLLARKIGRTDMPGSDLGLLRTSVDEVLSSVDDDVVLFGGHGKPWRAREAREWWNNARHAPPELKSFE